MINALPACYRERMIAQLGAQADAYFASLEQPYCRGLRLNPRKPLSAPQSLIPGLLSPIPWQQEAYYLSLDSEAGALPLHEAGAYYLQEPSAMAPVTVLSPQPGEIVLDLCAAPGGKSTQIADRLEGRGLLVCNEPVPSRAKILSRNLERMGVVNGLVVSAEPEKLAESWSEIFDAVLVDAPCSGEGMFRRHPETRGEWTEQAPIGCAARQLRILTAACRMLKPGGRLVYSTCTFNREENEQTIEALLHDRQDMSAIPFELPINQNRQLQAGSGTLHLYPHEIKGEGHFVALLHKEGHSGEGALCAASDCLSPPDPTLLKAYAGFEGKPTGFQPNAQLGDMLLAAPKLPPLRGIKVLRAGLQLGSLKGKLFFPDHALAMGSAIPYELPTLALSPQQARSYQRGEELCAPESLRGFLLLTYEGLALGFGKASQGQLKNHYPKGLRRP
ncbi:MAG: RsmB/NOP family class I SAM-dependent RNA methyltransferase [Eubacteriales bacterium]|nr:RsmB/NOP family class I SAM-dependent RNA methyltransferase [Eubacteriales bacterium]